MKKIEVLHLYKSLNDIKGYKGHKFNYAIIKNIQALESEVKILEKEEKRILEIKEEFEKQRIELCKSYAAKDEEGHPRIENGSYVMEDLDVFRQKLAELQETHKQQLGQFMSEHQEFSKAVVEDDINIMLHRIKLDEVPHDISTEDMRAVMNIIEE